MVSHKRGALLLLQLLASYTGALLIGSMFIFLNNIAIFNQTLPQLLRFNIPFVWLSCIAMAIVLLAISYWRLYPVFVYFRHGGARSGKHAAFIRLNEFPQELFAGMLAMSAFFILLYHLSESHWSGRAQAFTWAMADILIWELCLATVLAMLLYSTSRRLLRRYILQLEIRVYAARRRRSYVAMAVWTAFICFTAPFIPGLRLAIRARPEENILPEAILLSSVYALFFLAVWALFIWEVRQELATLLNRLQSLASSSGAALHKPVPLLSLEEPGRLAGEVNRLQERMSATYRAARQHLELAGSVQAKLLPQPPALGDGWEIAVSCRPSREVGGDFYDLIPLEAHRYAIAIGDVSGKGLPAALLMSAVMVGMRTEAARGGTAGDILSRLNRHVHELARGKMYATLGLAIIDTAARPMLDYASAGHLDPYLLRGGQPAPLMNASLPLGMFPNERYTGHSYPLEAGDLLILYTDGIIESSLNDETASGFDWWESQLRQLEQSGQLQELLSTLLGNLPLPTPVHESMADDQTLLLLRVGNSGEAGLGDQDRSTTKGGA